MSMLAEQKIGEATDILASIGMPRAQLNDRSALCLLALLDLIPEDYWYATSRALADKRRGRGGRSVVLPNQVNKSSRS